MVGILKDRKNPLRIVVVRKTEDAAERDRVVAGVRRPQAAGKHYGRPRIDVWGTRTFIIKKWMRRLSTDGRPWWMAFLRPSQR